MKSRKSVVSLGAVLLVGCSIGSDKVAEHDHLHERTQAAFANGDFEDGTNNTAPPNWTVTAYSNPGVTYPPTSRTQLNLGSGGSAATITRVTTNGPESEFDASLGASSTLRWPKYGSQVALVNNTNSGAVANSLRQTMTIATGDIDPVDGKPHVRFTVAPVLENPGHSASQQPYYFVQLRNVTKATTLYQDFNASAQPGVPWKAIGGVNYTDWQLVDISPGEAAMGVGDQVELEVIASRCSPSGHFGRVYVDGVGSTIPGLFVSGSAPSGANRGDNVTYTLNYTNGGTGAAGGVVVDFHVPTDTTWVGLSAPGLTCTQPSVGATGTASCTIGTVSPGASGSFTVTVNINPGSSTNLITAGHYEIAATGVNPLLGPKMYTTVTTGVSYADLEITKDNQLGGVGWGQDVTYDVVVTNHGPSAVVGAAVTDTFPAQLTGATWSCVATGGGSCAATSGSTSIATTVDLPVGATASFQVLGSIIAGTGSGTITNTATVAAPGGTSDTNSTNNSAVDSDAIGELRYVTVRKYGDAGTVGSVPSAITCGTSCSSATGAFVDGMTITLNAVPGPGETFLGWGGGCSGENTACTFVVGADVDVFAIFEADPRANGLACSAGTQCASGECVDGVCCDTACGGGQSDCQSCVVAGSEGTCSLIDAGTTCSLASCTSGVVTTASTCDGISPTCATAAQISCDGHVCSGDSCMASCAGGADCTAGNYCDVDTGSCEPLVAQGEACTDGAACASGNCVDGVCCNNSCTGQCEACNLVAAPGVCLPVSGPPVGGRAACETDGSLCGGACDGALRTACAYPSAATSCGAASCTAGTATLATSCDGAGNCPTAGTQDCGVYTCGDTACLGDCAVDDDCADGNHCSAGVCVGDLTPGDVCARDGECGTGQCTDGVCCDSVCEGQCEACNVEGQEGTCVAVSGDPVGTRPACASDGSLCAGSCDGIEREACSYPGDDTSCRDASCSDGEATLAAACDGAGSCPTVQTQDCGTFLCGETACLGDCTIDADCAEDSYCSAGVCVEQQEPGEVCSAENQCASGHCIDGVCCDTACTGQCEACDVPDQEGVCSPVTGAPHGARAACATDGSACGGACDGVAREACAFPTSTTSCRAPSCTDGVATLAAGCDGQGSCPDVDLQDCGSFTCGAVQCRGDCTRTADCASDSFCSGGVCTELRAPGDACSSAEQCGTGHCVDGVCCDEACDGQCAACDVAGQEGTCSAVMGNPRGGRPACLGQGVCRGVCDGETEESCTFPAESVTCGDGSCESGYMVSASSCDGAGLCRSPTGVGCGAYACGTDACEESCETDRQCAAGMHCVDGECGSGTLEPEEPEEPESSSGSFTGGGFGCAVSRSPGGGSGGRDLGLVLALLGAVVVVQRRSRRQHAA